jgi:hypothetical protein
LTKKEQGVRAKLTYSQAGHHAEYNPVGGGVGFLRPSGHQAVTCPKLRKVFNTAQVNFLLCLFTFFLSKRQKQTFRIPHVFLKAYVEGSKIFSWKVFSFCIQMSSFFGLFGKKLNF